MNSLPLKSVFTTAAIMSVVFHGGLTSAGNLPGWGGGATTSQPQQIQQPRQPVASQPAANTASTVQQQPGTWTAPGNTPASPAWSAPARQQPGSFQLKPGATSVRPAAGQNPADPGTYNATRAQQTVTPVSYFMQVAPQTLQYEVNAQGEVTGDRTVEINFQTNPAVGSNQSCDPRMTDVQFYYRYSYPPGTTGVRLTRTSFSSVNLQQSQMCNFSLSTSFQVFQGQSETIRQIACDPGDQRVPKPTEVTLQASVREITVITQQVPQNPGSSSPGAPETIQNSVERWVSGAIVTIPMSFSCVSGP